MSFFAGAFLGVAVGIGLAVLFVRSRHGTPVLRRSFRDSLQELDGFPDPLALTENGRVVFRNSAFNRAFGLLSGHSTWLDWLGHADPGENLDPALAPPRLAETSGERSEWRFRIADGRLVQWTAVSFPGLGRKLVLNILRDIGRWAGADYDVAAFMNRAAHELKTPVTAIKGYAELLEIYVRAGKSVSPDVAQRIVQQSNRLVHLVNQLLDVSRLATGRFAEHPEPSHLAPLLDATVERIRRSFPERRIEIGGKDDPDTVVDPVRFENVVRELLFNALQYSPADAPVSVTLRDAGTDIELEVADRGIGIPAAEHAAIYDRFVRASNVGSMPGSGGFGLGLYLVKAIIERWKGDITLESDVGRGTRVTVRWPKRAPPRAHYHTEEEFGLAPRDRSQSVEKD